MILKNMLPKEFTGLCEELLEYRELSLGVSVIIKISMTGESGRDVAQSGSAHAWGA
jgi:hypothetical protein